MDAVLIGLRDIECLVYLDDIFIFSATIAEHVRRIRLVFERIREANFKLGIAKCVFAASKVKYLGHILGKMALTRIRARYHHLEFSPT
jgi:hypothetical protein